MSRKRDARHSRRDFLKTAVGVSAGTMLMRDPLWAQGAPARKAATSALTKIHQPFMMTPKQALDWHVFKAECGPTYAGSTGWKRYTDFLISKMPEAYALANKVSAAWVAFARTGDPNTSELPKWPAYSAASRDTMLFNNDSRVQQDPDRAPRLEMERQLKLS